MSARTLSVFEAEEEEAKELVSLIHNPDPAVALAACREVLNRAAGGGAGDCLRIFP